MGMTVPNGHGDRPDEADEKPRRTEKDGDEEERDISACECAVEERRARGLCSEEVEEVVEHGKDDEARSGRIEEVPELLCRPPGVGEDENEGSCGEKGECDAGRVVADANDSGAPSPRAF